MINNLRTYLVRFAQSRRARGLARAATAKGFTLIETLVAVLILATAIAGPLTLASKGLSAALVAKDQTIADYLAQDAVEYLRFARDSNGLQGIDWLAGGGGSPSTVLTPCISTDGSAACYLDSLANSPSAPQACLGSCPAMQYDTSSRAYNYSGVSAGNVQTPFTRTIRILTPVCQDQEAQTGCNQGEAAATITVSWSDLPGVVHSVIVHENLLDWE